MEITAIMFMIGVLLILWGGFGYTLLKAVKREGQKNTSG